MVTRPNAALRPRVRFVSLRWRFIFPLAIVILVVAMVGAYGLAQNLTGGFAIAEENVLLQSTRTIHERSMVLYERHRAEAQRLAFTEGVGDAVQANNSIAAAAILRPLLATSALDSMVVVDAAGREVAGVLRDGQALSVSRDTDLRIAPQIRRVLDEGVVGANGLMQTPDGIMVFTAVPINNRNGRVGVAMVGRQLDAMLETLQASALTDLVLYDAEGTLANTTLELNTALLPGLQLQPALVAQINATDAPVKADVALDQTPYRVVYAPFTFGRDRLGVLASMMPNNIPFVTEIGRQLTAIMVSALAGAAVIAAFIGVSLMTHRMERVTQTVQALAQGQAVRTRMQAVDEIGAVGVALDHYADMVAYREDKLKSVLRKKRRERNYLLSVLESMPDGVLVQDRGGRVLVMNDRARALLGTQDAFRHAGLQRFESMVPDVLGQALAPGIYALGDPQQVEYAGKMLRAQAAAILSQAKQRIGTVVIVRDITDEVRQQQARDALLHKLAADVQQPLAAAALGSDSLVGEFAREISRHAASLQKMIVDMRELTQYNRMDSERHQRPIRAETLLWAVANDWRQIAQAADLHLQIMFERKNLYVLGDESRLRYALGNVVDNAIKYTPPGGLVSVEIKDAVNGMVHFRIRDNGMGISDVDMPHIFMAFYRGTPLSAEGQMIRVPGMGQGLTITQQIIEAHGGIVRVKSKPGVGTAVYFALPETSGVGYTLPMLKDELMEGLTVEIPENADLETYWQR